jgi:hypothetical protein
MINQHPDESAKAWRGYLCYQDLGPMRTVSQAYAQYCGNPENPSRPSSSFIRWKADYDWDGRVKLWDTLEQAAARERQRAIDDAAYQSELERFRRIQLTSGKQGVAIALNLKTKLLKWVETSPTTITTWVEALTIARIVTAIEMPSTEQWAKSLHIDRLLEQMLDDSEIE